MRHYYNEFDPKAAAWLRELIRAGLIPDGHVDTRSIAEVQPGDLAGFVQCHFFAGIGGWPLALMNTTRRRWPINARKPGWYQEPSASQKARGGLIKRPFRLAGEATQNGPGPLPLPL